MLLVDGSDAGVFYSLDLILVRKNIPVVIAVCCSLLNIYEAKGGKLLLEWRGEVDQLSAEFEQLGTIRRAICGVLWLREALKKHLTSESQ